MSRISTLVNSVWVFISSYRSRFSFIRSYLGPVPLPMFGNTLSFLNNNMEHSFMKWKEKYGSLHTIWLGSQPVVILHDSPTIYETFLKDGEAYVDRGDNQGLELLRKGRYGVVFSDGDLWREHRRFTLRVFRDFGLGKNLMQERIIFEVTSMVADIKNDLENNQTEFSLQEEIDRSVGSIINLLTFGHRYGRERKEEFKKVKQYGTDFLSLGGHPLMKIMDANIDRYKNLPIFKQFYTKALDISQDCEEYFMEKIREHKKKIDLNSDQDPEDYIEAYLRQQHLIQKNGEKSDLYCDRQLYGMIVDLWLAGQETTSNTLSWLCIYLINRPEIQRKVHEELDKFIGTDRIVTVDDKNNLNYVNAVIAETQRYCNLVPINVLHKTTKEVKIHGYTIPKGTTITHQISTVLKDSRYFRNPENFDPERFLDKDGKFFTPPELMPFGIGKRACLGEGLARMELFLFATNIFNQLKLKPVDDKKISEERIVGGTTCSVQWTCTVGKRH